MSCTVDGQMDQKGQRSIRPPLPFEVGLSIQGSTFQVQYQVKNTRDKPIYLFNALWGWDEKGNYVLPPSPVYVCLKREGFLHLAKRILPLPRGRRVEVRIVPFATKVEVGQEFSETLQLALPIQEYNPYFPPDEQSTYQIMTAEAMVFSLQFVGELEELKVQSAPLPGALHLQHPKLLSQVETLQSDTLRVQVPVKKRLDEFEEF